MTSGVLYCSLGSSYELLDVIMVCIAMEQGGPLAPDVTSDGTYTQVSPEPKVIVDPSKVAVESDAATIPVTMGAAKEVPVADV